ncbi:unnamed protein product [Urochloa humidicola]
MPPPPPPKTLTRMPPPPPPETLTRRLLLAAIDSSSYALRRRRRPVAATSSSSHAAASPGSHPHPPEPHLCRLLPSPTRATSSRAVTQEEPDLVGEEEEKWAVGTGKDDLAPPWHSLPPSWRLPRVEPAPVPASKAPMMRRAAPDPECLRAFHRREVFPEPTKFRDAAGGTGGGNHGEIVQRLDNQHCHSRRRIAPSPDQMKFV